MDTFFQLFQFELPSWYHGIFSEKIGSKGGYAVQRACSVDADWTTFRRGTSSPQKKRLAEQNTFG